MVLQNKMGSLAVGLAVFILMGMMVLPVGSAPIPASVNLTPVVDPATPEDIEEKWGVQIVGVRLTAAGHMLDIRYKVIDPEKAAFMLNRKNKAQLIDQKSNTALRVKDVPKIGRLRQSTPTPTAGRIYFMLFPNPGFIKAQSKVTLVVGNLRAENLVVED
jgi:hypothetical protein